MSSLVQWLVYLAFTQATWVRTPEEELFFTIKSNTCMNSHKEGSELIVCFLFFKVKNDFKIVIYN